MPVKKSKSFKGGKNLINNFIKKSYTPKVTVIVAVLIVIGLLYYFKGLFLVASVNGEPITSVSVIQELEKQNGKHILDSQITKILILQEAKKQNVNVSKDEINNEIKKIEKSFPEQGQLDQMLSLRGMTKNDLVEQIKIQKLIEKMVGKDIKVSDKEISDYIEKNKTSIPEGAKPQELNAQIKTQLQQQKLAEKFQPWLENRKKNAKISYFLKY